MVNQKQWLNAEELAEEFGISVPSQNRYRAERKIPFSKVGRFIRYNRDDISTWLKKHTIVGV
jgi:excisionase family DNA binding protein